MKKVWQTHRIVVCMGDGGVGKTTVAAAMGMAAAHAGRRVLVLTIDPSRRLAQALGFDEGALARGVGIASPTPVSVGGITVPGLFAQWLDVQATFDGIIRRRAPSEESAERIIQNAIYRQFSSSLAGSHEYAAVEKLFEAHADSAYDLIILDTPPSQNAMDFLGAPRRIIDFLDNGRLPKMLDHPMWQKRGLRRLFDVGTNIVTKTLDGVVGAETMGAIGTFLFGLREMYDGFRERASAIETLLASSELAFLVVGTAGRSQRATLETLVGDLAKAQARPAAIVINRMLEKVDAPGGHREQEGTAAPAGEGAAELYQALAEEHQRYAEAIAGADAVRRAFPALDVTLCPEVIILDDPRTAVAALVPYFVAG